MTGYVGHIDSVTRENAFFRRVLFTAAHLQLVVMCLQPGDDIGDEVHAGVDQLFRIEEGEATIVLNETERHRVRADDVIVVPAGTWHNVINAATSTSLWLYTLYAPPNHPIGTVHRTRSEAAAAELSER